MRCRFCSPSEALQWRCGCIAWAFSLQWRLHRSLVAMAAIFQSGRYGNFQKSPLSVPCFLWKDGQETLLISSALDSESQKLGWIIPLPAAPNSIEKQSPGGLKTLDFCIQPEITHDLHPQVVFAIYAFFVANLALATLLFKKNPLGFLLLELFLFGVVPALMLPAFGRWRYVYHQSWEDGT